MEDHGTTTRGTEHPGAPDAAPASRPGVPEESDSGQAARAPRAEPARQEVAERHLHRAGLDRPTPVVGTAQPPRGLSGALRRTAYDIPETRARHWMLLMLGDRVDVMEDRLGAALAAPAELVGLEGTAERARRSPLLAALVTVGVVAVASGVRSLARTRP